MNHRIVPILAALALTAPVLAARPAVALNCAEAANTVEMIECADIDYKKADKHLNQSYAAAKKTLDAEGAKLLLDAQRAWIKFRDTNCAVVADQARGGTLAPQLAIGCAAGMTETRAKELDEQAKGLGN